MQSSLNLSHQIHLVDPGCVCPVTIIGAGSVGGFVAMLLAKSGVVDLTVYDDDSIESHNIPMSIYGVGDIAKFKVDALKERIEADTGVSIKAVRAMYEAQPLSGTVIACVDTMSARSNIWKSVCGNPRVDLFVDTRTLAAYHNVYAIDPHSEEDVEEYTKSLYSDKDAVRQSCGVHGVGYATVVAASSAVSQVLRFWQHGTKKLWHAERRDTLESIN